MPNCLIITPHAEEFASEIRRLSEIAIPLKSCTSSAEALARYTNETVLFGNPAMIAPVLAQMPTVDWVQSSWAGVTPLIELDYRDYVLTGVKDVFGPQMSEFTIGYLLAHELKIAERLNAQHQHKWFRDASGRLEGKCLGIMGTGSIGQHVANTSKAFGIKVIGLSRSGEPAPGFDLVMRVNQLHDFLAGCDYLLSTLPQTNDTDNLLDASALAQLPDHAYFVNVGRSNVVDDDALIDALRNNKLAGATLDVFDEEPIPADSPLWEVPNLTITAHIAAISHPLLLVPVFIDNYRRYISKQPLRHEIDFDTGY